MYNEKYIATLQEMVLVRRERMQKYKESELLGFLDLWLRNLESYETDYQLYHSNISPLTLVLTLSSDQQYKVIDTIRNVYLWDLHCINLFISHLNVFDCIFVKADELLESGIR